MLKKVVRLIVALVLLGAAIAFKSVSPSAQFDQYVLALTWHPGFCTGRDGKPECRQMDTFATEEFVLHGLWPDEVSYCNVGVQSESLSKSGQWCEIDVLPAEDQYFEVPAKRSLMPGSHERSCLDRHEWVKHGTCSGLDFDEYYDLSLALVSRFAESKTSDYVAANRGRRVGRAAFYRVVAEDFGRDGAWKVQAICNDDRLTEVRLMLRADVEPNATFTQWVSGDAERYRAKCGSEFFID
ncbi:MAG: hypothetical protein HWE20_00325 [Gammaproteobacteria bacterium]|nr:hypothetical protein [Gammaproteobacteria bacterium]